MILTLRYGQDIFQKHKRLPSTLQADMVRQQACQGPPAGIFAVVATLLGERLPMKKKTTENMKRHSPLFLNYI